MRVLLTNDDGIEAAGLQTLRRALLALDGIELDSYPAHGHRSAFERDHRRDVVHRDAGYEVLRFTGRQLEHEPFYVLVVIARALDRLTPARG